MLEIQTLSNFVSNANAIRRIRKLQPVGGKGDYVSPPTYKAKDKTTIHVFETRRIDNDDINCVLLDSVQSQANRLENALTKSIQSGDLKLPRVEVDFRNDDRVKDIGTISDLEAPHRIFDAIIRDSELNGVEFLKTDVGRKISEATPHHALALFEYSPTTLLFGGWNSTGDKGGNGPRFQRCIVSEIIGIGIPTNLSIDKNGKKTVISPNKKSSSRIDPIQIEKVNLWLKKNSKSEYTVEDKPSDEYEQKSPSEIVHGNIPPSVEELGVTMNYGLQTTVITLAGLRNLSFPDKNGDIIEKQNLAACTTLASLALFAITEQDNNGYSLRSRCDLVPENTESHFEVIHNDGKIESFALDRNDAIKLLNDSITNAKKSGLQWDDEPKKLTPQKRLVELIMKSRNKKLGDKE